MRARRDKAMARSGFLLVVNHGEVEGAELLELRTQHAQAFFRNSQEALRVAQAVRAATHERRWVASCDMIRERHEREQSFRHALREGRVTNNGENDEGN